MVDIIPSHKVYIKESRIKNAGRGVFALKNIKKGQVIEQCPFVEIPYNDPENIFGGKLVTYFFYFGKNKKRIAFALGFGSLYNHSEKANSTYKIKVKQEIIEFIALKDIKKDEEVTFNYKNNYIKKKEKPLWFE